MSGLDLSEILVVGLIVLIFVGPERMPQVVRTIGRLYGQFRRSADELRRALVLEADRMDEEERLRQLVRRREAAEARRRAESEQAEAPAEPTSASGDAPADGGRPDNGGAPGPEAELPPGFTAAEWDELPAHVKAIIQNRRNAS